MSTWLTDTGSLVALLISSDWQHVWAVEQTKHAPTTVLTCDAVISEALFLLKRAKHNTDDLFALVEVGFLQSRIDFHDHYQRIRELMRRYKDRPMSFADACLVCVAEQLPSACIWTMDQDFQVYRKHGRQSLTVVAPWQ